MYRLSKRSLGRLRGVNPLLIAVLVEGIKDSPYDFGIPEYGGVRTKEEQQKLFNDNKSKCDGIVDRSYHQSGNAFDIYIYENGRANWEPKKLKAVARHLQEIAAEKYGFPLSWGGDWTSWKDWPHFELRV